MLESSFMYIAAVVSIFAIAYVVGTIFLILNLRDNFSDVSKLHLPAVIFAGVYEAANIALACVIMQDVIINIYCYLFLTNAFIVLCTLLIYVDYYRRAKKRYYAAKEVANDKPVDEPAKLDEAPEAK